MHRVGKLDYHDSHCAWEVGVAYQRYPQLGIVVTAVILTETDHVGGPPGSKDGSDNLVIARLGNSGRRCKQHRNEQDEEAPQEDEDKWNRFGVW